MVPRLAVCWQQSRQPDCEFGGDSRGGCGAGHGPEGDLKANAEKQCRSYGPGYSAVGNTGLCTFVGGGILLQLAQGVHRTATSS